MGAYGLRTTSVTQNNGGHGERVDKALALAMGFLPHSGKEGLASKYAIKHLSPANSLLS